MLRLFVAIDLPAAQRRQIKSICAGLPGARWIRPEQIHLTMRFIGEVDDRLFRAIADKLAAVRAEPFSLKIKGVGHFPPRRPSRVLWIGVEQNAKLVDLRDRIETALVRSGLEAESREFAPHITIARFRKEKTPVKILRDFMAANSLFELSPFAVGEFHLYSSRLGPGGASHRRERSFPLPFLDTLELPGQPENN